jgi:DNA-binding GntR family transcriptional regulator
MNMPRKALGREKAYALLLDDIMFGDLPPGGPIEEKGLAKRYGLGVASVRDALARLAIEGLIERVARRGTRVAPLDLSGLYSVFEARVMVESRCAALAAERATASDLREMKEALAGYEAVIKARDFRQLVHMDRRFHRALAAASKNRSLAKVHDWLHNDAMRFWYLGLQHLDPMDVRADIALHLTVIVAIERRDPAAAAAATRNVLGHFPDTVRTFMSGAISSQQEGRTNERGKAAWRHRKRPEKAAATA